MIVYLPTFDHGWNVQKIDTTAARLFKNRVSLNRYTLECRGILYNGENLYQTEAGAMAYINRDYKTEREQRIEPETITDWKGKVRC